MGSGKANLFMDQYIIDHMELLLFTVCHPVMRKLDISPLLESITLAPRLLEKISVPQRCRLRSTCRRVNEIVEKCRVHLANIIHYEVLIKIQVIRANTFVVKYGFMEFDKELILPKPIEQLSGLRINCISFEEKRAFSPKKQAELVDIFERWRPHVKRIEFGNKSELSAQTIKGILLNSSIEILNVRASTISIEELISLESVQNADDLTLDMNIGGIPQERVLERLKKVKTIDFFADASVEWRDYVINTVLPMLTQESNILQEDERSPWITFYWDAPIDAESIYPHIHMIYSRVVWQPEEGQDFDKYVDDNWSFGIYAQTVQNRIFLLIDSILDEKQMWRICFLEKNKNSLKKTLETEAENTVSDSILDYMFKKIVGEQ